MADIEVDPLNEAAKQAASIVNIALAQHERENHDGQPCADERVNMLAYLAHRIGVSRRDVERLVELIVWYHREHQEKEEGH